MGNAAWAKLAAEFLQAKNDPSELMVFCNTVLAQGWRESGEEVEDVGLASRGERFDLDNIPADVLIISIGVDCQDDRLECVICGWGRDGTCFVLAHEVIWGSYEDEQTWSELDKLLTSR